MTFLKKAPLYPKSLTTTIAHKNAYVYLNQLYTVKFMVLPQIPSSNDFWNSSTEELALPVSPMANRINVKDFWKYPLITWAN